jgi:DUF4097 and DUF4098 domain-containing protein YvlB
MKLRTVLSMAATLPAYVLLLLPLPRVRAQSQPVAPVPPAMAAHAIPAEPAVPATPAEPAAPALPASPASPASPAQPAAPAEPTWGNQRTHGHSTHWSHEPAADCSDLDIRLNDERPTIVSEERTLTRAEAPVLRVHEVQNGGVQVHGWEKDTYSVTACKAAVGGDAQRLLSQIKLSVQGGEVAVSAPSGQHNDWTVYLLIRTPRSADVEVTAHNGPVSFYGVDGKLKTRATNGPISMTDCSGEADISAENGPISFSGTSGKLRLHTQNGPITVSLGQNWDGSELVADAVNGPLTLRVPSGFHSSFLVESNGHSPVSCHASICSDARKTWDDDHRRIEYGSGSPVIRLSTENGPISVAD